MFWNDPNLYSVAFKDTPNVSQFPRFMSPYTQIPYTPFPQVPQMFTPPIAPTYFNPQYPSYFTPPVTPYFQTPTQTPFVNPLINPMLGHYGYTLPLFQGYRPFGI